MSRKRAKFKKESIDNMEDKPEKKEQEREDYDAFEFMKNKKTAAVAGVFFVLGVAFMWTITPSLDGMVIQKQSLPTNANEIAQQGVDFLNKYFVSDGGVSLVSVENDGELMNITTEYDGSQIPVQMTKDGEYIILGGIGSINIAEFEAEAAAQETTDSGTDTQTTEVQTSDVPVVDVFVMSHCPYGLQMEKAVIPVMELIGDKADINIDYVNYLMHGEAEMNDNNYEYCIQRDQPEKFTEYMRCFLVAGDHEGCVAEAGIDTANLDSCVAEIDATYNITGLFNDKNAGNYPPYMVNNDLNVLYGVQGSPTVVINGQVVSVSRSQEAVKEAICGAFTNPPEECQTTLSTTSEAASFGAIGGGTTTTSTDAQCG